MTIHNDGVRVSQGASDEDSESNVSEGGMNELATSDQREHFPPDCEGRLHQAEQETHLLPSRDAVDALRGERSAQTQFIQLVAAEEGHETVGRPLARLDGRPQDR